MVSYADGRRSSEETELKGGRCENHCRVKGEAVGVECSKQQNTRKKKSWRSAQVCENISGPE